MTTLYANLRHALNALDDVQAAARDDHSFRLHLGTGLPRYDGGHHEAAMTAHGRVLEAVLALRQHSGDPRLQELQNHHYDTLHIAAASDSFASAAELDFITDPHVRTQRAAEQAGAPLCTCDRCYEASAIRAAL